MNRKAESDIRRKLKINEIFDNSNVRLSYRAIAKQLNCAGYRTARGMEFTQTQVYRILKSTS